MAGVAAGRTLGSAPKEEPVFKTSVLALDGSEGSRKAIPVATELARQNEADAAGAELIVLGTRGHSPVAGLLLGSVTQRLLHIARRPVLAVPEAKT